MKKKISTYQSIELPEIDPLTAVEALMDVDQAEYFWVYSSNEETVAALGIAGQVVVTDQQVESSWESNAVSIEPVTVPFEQVGRLLGGMPISDWRAFGHVAFDAAGFYYPYSLHTDTSQMRFIIPKTELVVTAQKTVVRGLDDLQSIVSAIQDAKPRNHASPNVESSDPSDRKDYEGKVSELIRSIKAGQLTKAILARQVCLPRSIDVFSTFANIRDSNPAARTFCFRQEDLSGIGSSPEVLMQTTSDGSILTNPLAGTRPRGDNKKEDERLMKELQSDPKEVKEHEISVRLTQEELESICIPGSVKVMDFMQVVPFRTVQHLASTVVGQLSEGHTLWDGLRALFPGVTVSGIDKDAAIQKIAELEQVPRGPYAGCVGWVDSNGASDFAISLRSAFEDKHGVSFSAGAGIIAESIPDHEYDETVNKMRTIQGQLVLKK